MADVFVSYKKEDRERAQRLVKALNAEGYSVWWDERLAPAEHWDEEIQREITAARAVVVLWTPAAVKSQWVRSEAEFAKKHNKLVPATLVECELPISFMLVQAIDLTRWSGERDHRNWLQFTAWVRDLVSGAARQAQLDHATAPVGADWRAKYGEHVNGEPILDGAAITRTAPAGTVFKDGQDSPLMCVVAGGRFTMGAAASEPDSQVSERPQRQISVAGPFALSVYPVTFEEWDVAQRSGGVRHAPRDEGFGRGRIPAINVSWNDAQDYVAWLSQQTGQRYRLPGEAEWEYCCRAGSDGVYGFNGPITGAVAHYGAKRPSAVGAFPPNRFGLYDMHGNVREWVEDTWHDNYSDAPADSIAWTSGHSAMRIVRGGGWPDAPKFLRSAARGRAAGVERCGFIGFRVAREIR